MKVSTSIALVTLSLMLLSCSGDPPSDLGVHEGQLRPCPESPNCVVTHKYEQNDEQEHFLPPIELHSTDEKEREHIARLIETSPRAKVIQQTDDYIRAEFTSRIFRFVDDVEFYFPPSEGNSAQAHFRSASRIGHSDLGVNKKRMEQLRFRYHQRDYR